MRQSVLTRLMLALVLTLSLAMAIGTQAAPAAQEAGPAQGLNLIPARVAFVHAAPFQTGGNSEVTLTATQGTTTAIIDSSFTISETISYVTMPAGTYTFRLYVGSLGAGDLGTAIPAYSEQVTLQGGTDYTVVAAGTNSTLYPLDLIPFVDTLPSFVPATQGLVRIIHAAPLPTGPTNSAVDIVNEADSSFLAQNLGYGAGQPFTALPANAYNVVVNAAGTATPLFNPPALPLPAGTIVTLVAAVDSSTGLPGIIALPFTPRASAQVRVVHAAPFASGDATATPVLDPIFGSDPVTGFRPLDFGQHTLYKQVAPGIYDAKVVAGESITGTVAFSQSLTIPDGARLTVVVIGSGDDPYPLDLAVLSDDRTQPAGSATADVRIFHAAPFAPTIPQTGVDVVTQDGGPLPAPVTDLTYGEVTSFPPNGSPYTTLPSGVALDLKIVATGTQTTVLDLEPLTLGAGTVQTVIAIGGANQQAPSVVLLNDLQETITLRLPLVWQNPIP